MGCSYETKDASNLKRHKSNHTKALKGQLGNLGGAGNVGNECGAPIGISNAQKSDAETARNICNCKGVEQSEQTAVL